MKEDKTIDNKIIEKKKAIEKIDNRISQEKKLLDSYDQMEESIGVVKNIINDIAYYLSLSIKGKRMDKIVQEMQENNQIAYRNSMNKFDEERLKIKDNINKIYNKKDELQNELDELYSQINSKEKKEEIKEEEKDNQDKSEKKENPA